MHGSTRSFLLVALLGTNWLTGQEGEVDQLVANAKAKLKAIGYEVPAKVAVSTRTAGQVIDDIDAQQELLFPRGAFEVQHALLSALGLPAGKDARTLRRQSVAAMARGIAAYYDPVQKTFVLLPSRTRAASEALSGSLLPLVVHELVHGNQDGREGGLAAFFDAGHCSLDEAQARRCVMEGEAELAAALALRGEEAVPVLADDGGTLDKIFAGELTGLIYQHGRRLAARTFLADGKAGVAALWQRAPSSTEQVLHPVKLGKDLPTTVLVQALPGCVRQQATTFGELMIYHLLRQLGRDTTAAALTAVGWDGDQVVVLQHDASKSEVVVWRSVWDRPEDAAQFAEALPAKEHHRLAVQGRVVDWLSAGELDEKARDELLAALRQSVPELPTDAEAAASTAAVEKEMRSEAARTGVSEGRWRHTALGLSLSVPEGFEVREVQGTKMLVLPASEKQGFLVNVNVMAQPRSGIADVQALLDVNRKQYERLGLTIENMEVGKVGEVSVVKGEYHGRIPGIVPIHCLQVMYLRGDQQVILTATAPPARWKEYEAVLRELMGGVTITP